jgi:SpoIIAA-like
MRFVETPRRGDRGSAYARRVVEILRDLPAGTLGLLASGTVTSDEFRRLMEPVYAALARGDKLNVYVELDDDFDGLDMGALRQDVKAAGAAALKHRSAWQRLALVTDKDWVKNGANAFGWMAPGELRLFEPSERNEARAWLASGTA